MYERAGNPNEELEAMLSNAFGKARRRGALLWIIPVVAVLLWVASGVYVVQPSEQGVVRTFGLHTNTSSPGINYRLPWPIQQVDVVDVQNIRRTEIGFRSGGANQAAPAGRRVLEEALMLTRDENIVEVGLLVQYRVRDAAEFVFNVQDPDAVLATTAEVALRSSVGQMPIDDVITERRSLVQENTRLFMDQLLTGYRSGIQVTDVRLQVADAPDQVRDAFHEVVRAREDRERTVNEAQAYREDVLPKARGEARQIIEAATAFQQERVRLARGDTERFLSILQEYKSAPDVTRERMYLETVEKVLAHVDKVIMDGGTQNNVLPFLPLRDAGAARPAAGTSGAPAAPQNPATPARPAAGTSGAPAAPPNPATPAQPAGGTSGQGR